jgi:hypothetical protein
VDLIKENMRCVYVVLGFFIIFLIFFAGCTSSNSPIATTPTPQIVYVTVFVTPTPTANIPIATVPTTQKLTSGQFPNTATNEKRQVTIYSVQKTSTYNWLGTSNKLTQKSKPGKIYIIIDAEVKYLGVIGISSIYTGPGDFSVSDIEGNRYDAEPYIGDDAFEILKELFKNQKTRGIVVFEVPTTAKGLTLYYDYGNLVPWGVKYATWEIN